MSLYFILLLLSAGIPLLLSFDKRLQFFKKWKYVWPAIVVVAILYIVFDIFFTKAGVWGFNEKYLSGIYLLNLPLEEILFFIAIPYASIFLHYSFAFYFPNIKLNAGTSKILTVFLMIASLAIALFHTEKAYTFYILIKMFVVLLLSLFDKTQVIRQFYVTFLLILVPFVIVNGILTGTGISGEIVWYNNAENLGIRIFTIPIEDFAYAFSLILFNLLFIKNLRKVFHSNK